MSDLAAALAAIHQEHSVVPCGEFTPSSAVRWAMCEHCGWESRRTPASEIRSWDETFRTLDAEHVAALQVAYLRDRFALTPLIARGDDGWPVDPDDDDFRVVPVHLVNQQTGQGLTGCKVSWGSVELNLTPDVAEKLATALLSALHHNHRLEPK